MTPLWALDLLCNLGLLACDGAALALLARRKPWAAAISLWAVCGWLSGAGLALLLPYMRAFWLARALSWLLFLHGPACLLAWAWLLRRGAGEEGRSSAWPARWAAGLGLALLGVGGWAFAIEPRWLQIRQVEVSARAGLSEPLRILLIADIQTDRVGAYEREALARGAKLDPDLVLLAGDYLQCWSSEARREETAALREAFRAAGFRPRLGIYAVEGDCETRDWARLFDETPVEPLRGVRELAPGLRLQGLSLGESASAAPVLSASPAYTITLGHRPDFALAPCAADLLLAGHTHGGQVQLPLVGPLVTLSRVPRAWAGGQPTALASGGTLVVARGVGMERLSAPRLRFGCRPELVLIEVRPR